MTMDHQFRGISRWTTPHPCHASSFKAPNRVHTPSGGCNVTTAQDWGKKHNHPGVTHFNGSGPIAPFGQVGNINTECVNWRTVQDHGPQNDMASEVTLDSKGQCGVTHWSGLWSLILA